MKKVGSKRMVCNQQSRCPQDQDRMAGAAALSLTLGWIPCKLLTSDDLATYLPTGHPLRTRLGFIQIPPSLGV